MDETRIEGRNAVKEAYRAGRTIDKLYVQDGLRDAAVREIVRYAKEAGTLVSYADKARMDSMAQSRAHQGVIAVAAAVPYSTLEEIISCAREKGEDPFVFVLDEIEDPHNLGAIIRTADAAGAHGVVIPKRHAATLTASCAKASAGAVFHMRIAREGNLVSVLEKLKEEGLWTVCAAADGEVMYGADLTGPVALVIGNEGSGVRPLVRKTCDRNVSIPLRGEMESLNASVAAGVLAYEVVRQRMGREN